MRAFRAPNSRHPKTGLHKRRLSARELMGLTHSRVAELAREPAPFDVPKVNAVVTDLEADWNEASEPVGRAQASRAGRPHLGKLQRATTAFVRDGAAEGGRNVRLFRAAADLSEFAAVHRTDALIHALLTEPALDSGLTPTEVLREIACGFGRSRQQNTASGGMA